MPNLIGIQKKKTASKNKQPFSRYFVISNNLFLAFLGGENTSSLINN